MPIKRINEFPSSSGATPDDLVLIMDDPSGSGITQRISIQSLFTSPALSGVPTAPTASSGTSTSQIASTAFVRNEISNLVDSAPALLDTLNELAAAINDDSGYFLTIGSGLALKANINNPTFTGYVTIPSGNGNFNTLTVGGTGVSISGHSHTVSNITDFSSAVSGLLPVKNVLAVSGIRVTSNSGTFTVSSSGLTSSYISDFASSVSGLLPVKSVVQGSGVSVTSSSGTFTVGVSGLNASYISDFASSVSGLIPTLSAGSGIGLTAGSGNAITIGCSGIASFTQLYPKVVNLSVVSSTISTDANAGQIFNVALTGSATLNNPTNPIDGVTLRWRIQQDAYGSHAVTLGDKFQIPTSATNPLPFSTAPYTIDLLAATYNSANDNWDIIAFVMGY